MADFADSERVMWRQAELLRRLRVQVRQQQQVIAVLARRQAGVLIIEPAEINDLPVNAVIVRADRPDGCTVLRVETGGRDAWQPEPGSEG